MRLGLTMAISPHKWTTPKEIGVPFPEIKKIYYGGCLLENTDNWHYVSVNSFGFSGNGAHTHLCPNDASYKIVCFSHEEEILNYDGSPSECLWHEYGHVLWKHPKEITNWKCAGPESWHSMDLPTGYTYDPHGEEWKQIMRNLGRPDLTTLWVRPSLKLAQAAALIK